MENKEVWISALIIIVLLALGVYLTQTTSWFESSYNYSDFENIDGNLVDLPMEPTFECFSDADCVKVQEDCCPCSSGGKDLCVSKENSYSYINNLNKCDMKEVICAQVYNCKINSCSCINGRCTGN